MTAGTDRDGMCPQGRAGRGTTVVPPAAAGVVGPRRSTAGLPVKGARCARVTRDGLRPPLTASLAGRAVDAVGGGMKRPATPAGPARPPRDANSRRPDMPDDQQDQQDQRPAGRGWRDRAACRDTDPELFYPAAESGPTRHAQVAAAKAVCARCPVRTECLTEALARIPYGIAGGLTEHERRRLRQTDHAPTAQARTGSDTAAAGEAGEVWVDGPRPGWTTAQRAGTGRALLAAGRPARQVARACGVSTRTAERWAATSTSTSTTASRSSSTTAAGTATGSAGVGEGSRGGHRAPLGPPTPAPRQGHEQQKGHRA
jgi:hypothetical protein